jgi:hypothetical protein
VSKGYTPEGKTEKKYYQSTKKRNLLLRNKVNNKQNPLTRRFPMNKKDHSRLEEFRQLQKEIRGSDEYLIVGIDVAKEGHKAFFGTATGKTLFRRLVFGNDREGFERLMLQAEAMRVQHGLEKVVFGLEPTANYHKPLGEMGAGTSMTPRIQPMWRI